MSETIESILDEYDDLVQKRAMLAGMIRKLSLLTEEDMIEVLTYSKPMSDYEIATFRTTGSPELYTTELRQKFLRKYQKELNICMAEYLAVDEKIRIIESAVEALPEKYSRLIEAIFFKHMKWEVIECEQHTCKKTIANHRRKALELLKDLCDWYKNKLQLDED